MLSNVTGTFATVNVLINNHLDLLCPFENFNNIRWRKENSELNEINSTYFSKQFISLQDAGNYTCFAENEAGINQFTYKVIVNSPPKIDDNLTSSNFDVLIGDTFTMECRSIGFPQPKVS